MNAVCEIEEVARRIADIVGEGSAAACAIKEMERRRSLGYPASIERVAGMWLVFSSPLQAREEDKP